MKQSTLNKHIVSITKLYGTGLGIELLQIEHKSINYFAGNIYIEALREIVTLREAGEKMAKQLREMRDYTGGTFTEEDAAALAEWEATNK